MPFEKRFNQIIQNTQIPPKRHLLTYSFLFSLAVFLFVLIYNYLRRGFHGIDSINGASAWTGVVLISLSMAISGICYFFNFADSKIIYRKYLGLVGFGYALMHAVISFLSNFEFGLAFFFGFAALLIFTMMAAISNQYAVHELGGVRWRRLLRFGYLALFFTIIHIYINSSQFWVRWMTSRMMTLPPIGIPLIVLAVGTLFLRLILEIALIRKKKQSS